MNLYWGDVHNHCGISYGYGSLENALAVARQHLDFCSVTGHAMWPDMPARTPELAFVVDFHREGFAKLAKRWDAVRATVEAANVPGEFATFQSYEIHSMEFGDHHLLSPSPDLPLVHAPTPQALVSAVAPHPAIVVPHHLGYVPGYRGANWHAFSPDISPVVEVYSKHGSSMSDRGPYPFLHAMGPRDGRNTVRAGLDLGHRFGFVASTDHHAGYPGSYGDGRLAVLAPVKTRQAIWEAILARRTYAVTGDKIACQFRVNGADLGSEIAADGAREIALAVRACDGFDKIIVYKNSRPWRVICGESTSASTAAGVFKVRVELGWGRSEVGFHWDVEAGIRDGSLLSVEPCFRGLSVLSPSRDKADDPDINALNNEVLERTTTGVAWRCSTFKNLSTLHPATAAMILEIEGDEHTVVSLRLNQTRVSVSLGELSAGSRGGHVAGYGSEAFLLHRPVPEAEYVFRGEWSDDQPEQPCDVYDVEVRQTNGQCAWVSPFYVLG